MWRLVNFRGKGNAETEIFPLCAELLLQATRRKAVLFWPSVTGDKSEDVMIDCRMKGRIWSEERQRGKRFDGAESLIFHILTFSHSFISIHFTIFYCWLFQIITTQIKVSITDPASRSGKRLQCVSACVSLKPPEASQHIMYLCEFPSPLMCYLTGKKL